MVDVGDGWMVEVVGKTANATAAVLAENQFNDPPAAGRQFFIVRVRLRRVGTTPDSATFSPRFSVVGPSNVSYQRGSDDSCGVTPDELSDNDVYPGGEIEGNVCWSVASSDANGLVMYAETLLGGDTTYFAL